LELVKGKWLGKTFLLVLTLILFLFSIIAVPAQAQSSNNSGSDLNNSGIENNALTNDALTGEITFISANLDSNSNDNQNSNQNTNINYKILLSKEAYAATENIIVELINSSGAVITGSAHPELDLLLTKGTDVRRYSGEMIFPVQFSLDTEGEYNINLINKNSEEVIDSKKIIISNAQMVFDTPVDENMAANITNIVNQILDSINNNSMANSSSDKFIDESDDCTNASINLSSENVFVGEEVRIKISQYENEGEEDGFELKITKGESTYRFLGYSKESRFTPMEAGNYSVSITCKGIVVSQNIFSAEYEIPVIMESRDKQIKLRNSEGKTKNIAMKIWSLPENSKRKGVIGELIGTSEVKDAIVEIDLSQNEGLEESKIRLDNFSAADVGNVELKIEKLVEENYAVDGQIPVQSYAMDLSNINFTNGTFSSVAKGNELWKCIDWNYETQSCFGSWTKLMDITPGQAYSFEVSPQDPGYAETGVSTINTRKSYYMPGEGVTIYAVVLDTKGYLVANASVDITVEAPDGMEYLLSTAAGQVVEEQKGIYSVMFYNTDALGNYTIYVHAKGQNVDHNMSSMFAVQTDYDFEIIRHTPLVTDPFRESLYSSITITPRIIVESYNFTEILPIELEVISAPGAVITIDDINNKTYLKWSGLVGNNTIEYTAQPPLKTPNVLRLGKAYVEYYFNGAVRIFAELREWLLAIDPEVPTDDGLVVYGDQTNVGVLRYRNWTSDVLMAEQSGPTTGTDNIVWIKLRCQKDLPVCILGVTNWDGSLWFSAFSTNNWTWYASQTLCSDTYNELWSWDLDCEATTNNCIIAYENRSGTTAISNNANFIYRVWNGTSLSGETTETVSGGENRRFNWIKLYPKKGNVTMGIALQNDFGGTGATPAIYGGIWNGTDFGTWQTFTNNGPSTGNGRTQYKHFDCGWEGGTGKLLCAYGENGVNSVFAQRYNGTAWENLTRIYNGSAEVLQVAMCGQEPMSGFNHSYVGLMECDTVSDLDGGIWNGTKFSKSVASDAPAKNTNSECGANQGQTQYSQNFQCTWEQSGNQSVFVWVRNSADSFLTSGTYTVSTGTFSQANWSTGVKITANGANQLRSSTLVSNPYNDKVFLVYTDASRYGGCSLWRGNTWDGSGCNNATTFETNGGQAARNWLGFDWFRLRLEPYITIIRPALISSEYSYYGVSPGGTQKAAYNGNTSLLPPTAAYAPINGTEFTAGNYYDSSVLDDSYVSSVFSAALTGQRAYQSYRFYVTDPTISLSQIKLTYEGYATRTTSFTADDYNIYFYNWNTDSYTLMRTVYGGTGGDIYSETLLTSSFTDYVQGNYFYVLIEAYTATGGTAASRRSEVSTDYISLDVDSRPVLSGNQLYNATATDKDGISGCRWAYYNTSYANVSGQTEMSLSGVYYYNVTNTTSIADGNYYIYVFCNDTLSNTRNNSIQVRIDNTPPNIILASPPNQSNFTVNYVLFMWNVTDIAFENMECNLTVDGVVKDTNRVSPHAQNVSKNVTAIADGSHTWYVRCTDDANNMNVSETRVFDTDTTAPVVTPNYPPSAGSINYIPFDINFTVTDSHPINNCSVYIDNVLNATFYNVTRSVPTNLTIYNMTQGLHRWNVSCYDSFNYRGNSALRNFTLDFGLPWINLSTPDNALFNGTYAQFNYTAYDTLDTSLMCNISVNDEIVDSNIPSANGSLIKRNLSLVDGYKVWFVICWDDAGNINTSESRTARVIGGPTVITYVPKNGTVGNGTNINFTYYAQDGDGIGNCTLYLNGIANQTNTSINNFANNSFFIADLPEGVYNWNISCIDLATMSGSSATNKLTSDRSLPSIALSGPTNGQTLLTTPTRFNYTMTDTYSPNATCNITVDGVVSATNRNIVSANGTLITKTETISNGLHYWNVTCIDLGGNMNTSATWNFTVNVTMPITVGVVADKQTYQIPEIAKINITTKNDTNQYIAANFTLDYIYTNTTYTDVPWFNITFPYRKPIYINETQGLARTDKPLPVNVTVPYGLLTSCREQLRVVDDSTLLEVAFNVIGGDDANYCYIAINASVAASAVNSQNYHVYYGNLSAPLPTYPNLTGGSTLLYDTFAGAALSAEWTENAGWDIVANAPLTGNHAHVDGSVTLSSIRATTYFDLQNFDYANLSFNWGISGNWDANEFLHYEFTNNSGATWTRIESFNGTLGALSSTETYSLNSSYKVNGFNIRFRATTDNANEEGGFDNFNLTGFNFVQSNVSGGVGKEQQWLERITNATNSSGMVLYNYTTAGKIVGNYSSVVRATSTNPKLRAGTGYDWFTIIGDVYGPNITLIFPTNTMTNRTGSYNLTYNASDVANGVRNCSLYIDGILNQSNSTNVNETGTNRFTILNMQEGKYNWSVSCFDNLDNGATSVNYTFYLDDTPPVIIALTPNETTLPSGTITFTFNATDNWDTQMNCNISVDNFNKSRVLTANNGSITTTTISNITDGDHRWNITCYDNINNTGYSETLNFTTASLPIVKLHQPVDGYGVNSTDIVLYYNLSSAAVVNCSLILNGLYNQTVNASEIPYKLNDGQNNFTLTGLSYGIYNWNVICFDNNFFNSTDTNRTFQLDNAAPTLVLYAPTNGQTVYTRNINFYFNATDNVDTQLICNLSLDGVVNKTNLPVNSGANTTTQITNVSMNGHNWSVNCVDNTGFSVLAGNWTFTIESIVGVSLQAPAPNAYDSDGTVMFSYLPQSTSGFNLGFCDLMLDNVFKQRKAGPTPDIVNYFNNVSGITEGLHSWYVNCTDNAAVINFSLPRNFTVDLTNPSVTTHYPDGNSFGTSTIFFNWTATDNMDQSLSCNVYVNGTLKAPGNVVSPNGSVANATYSGIAEGTFEWYVVCYDDALRNVTSSNKTLTVSEPPVVNLGNPANLTRTRTQNQTFYFTATDNSGSITNCSFIFDGVLNQTRSGVSSGVQSSFNLTNIENGTHTWNVNCSDPSGNVGINSSPRTLIMDLDYPIITQILPGDATYLGGNNAAFNWTAVDYPGTNVNCSLFIDNVFNRTITQQSGTYFTPTVNNLSDGTHYWNVTCSDTLGNYNSSATWSFTINQPDLFTNDSRLNFNNTNPDENQTINITVNVSNIGGVPVVGAVVEFWDGDPSAGGTLIGNDTGNIGFNSSRIFSKVWNITAGYHVIYAVSDPHLAIGELDETNNNASRNITVLKSVITNPFNATKFTNPNVSLSFNITDFTGGLLNYTLFINGTLNVTGQANDLENKTIFVNLSQGIHTLRIQAEDYLGRKKNSSAITITVDYAAPVSNITTVNATWYNYSTPQITITSTDNTDNMINYTIYANGAVNIFGNISSGATIPINLTTLTDGRYDLIMEGFDDLGNIANSTPAKTIFVDMTSPSIILNAPDNGANFTNRSVVLNYTAYDALSFNASCNITLDGVSVNYQTGAINQSKNYTASNLLEGTHYWNVTCRDQANNTNVSETRSFNVFTAPVITLVNPAPNAWVNSTNNIFYFNVSDETGLENCSIVLNGVVNQTKYTAGLINNGTNNITVTGMNGTYLWAVECYDNTSLKVYNITANRTINVDLQAPGSVIYTLNDTWFNTNPVIYFNVSDNMDAVLDYTIFVNRSSNVTGTSNNGLNASATLTTLSNGTFEIIVQARDEAFNYYNSSPIIIGFDTVVPSITLLYPGNNSNISTTYTSLNFTAQDNSLRNLTCNLTLDNVVVLQNRVTYNGENISYNATGLGGGYHYWNVTCVDIARNRNTSVTWRFYVLRPDIYVNASNIIFSNNEPRENETINITALIENLGNTAAANFTVEFWEGLPGAGGRQISTNTSINLTAGESMNVTVSYNTILGTRLIWVFADRANAVAEENETNNNASKSLSVGLWHFALGTTQDRLVMEDASLGLLFDWDIDNSSDTNIFVIDSDSNINWRQLQALGRDTSNNSRFSDFATLDTKLNSTGFIDSVNATYTSGGAVRETASYTIYGLPVNNVPIYNSTDNSNFKTGILWDYGDGGAGYNGTQDVAFITKMQNQLAGYNSTVSDYEIRIPATLRAYKGPTLNRVDFYMEIK
jgi:hypothetical protein